MQDKVAKEIIKNLGMYNFRVNWNDTSCSIIDEVCDEEIFKFTEGYTKINANMTVDDDIWSLICRLKNKWIDREK